MLGFLQAASAAQNTRIGMFSDAQLLRDEMKYRASENTHKGNVVFYMKSTPDYV